MESVVDCGVRCNELLGSLDLATCSLRTSQLCLDGELSVYSATLPRSGMTRSGKLYRRPTWVRPTSESASGSWPTPQAHDSHKGDASRVGRFGTLHGARNLNDEVMLWPSPMPSDVTGGRTTKGKDRPGEGGLSQAVKLWPTMTASQQNVNSQQTETRERPNGICLADAARLWPTPDVRGFTNDGALHALALMTGEQEASDMAYRAGKTKKARAWPTASSRDWKDTPGMARTGDDGRNRTDQLARRVYSEGNSQSGSGQLNPAWVCRLMGFPQDYLDLGDQGGKTASPASPTE